MDEYSDPGKFDCEMQPMWDLFDIRFLHVLIRRVCSGTVAVTKLVGRRF